MAEIELFEWGGVARAINFPSQEKCFCLTYLARRPDINRVLNCAKRKDLYSAKVDRNRQKHTLRASRMAFRNLGAKPPGKFLRTRPLLLPRMHLTTKFLNLDFDNFVTIFCRAAAPRNSLSLSNTIYFRYEHHLDHLSVSDKLEYLRSTSSYFSNKFCKKNLYFVLERFSPSNYCLPQT